MAFSHTLGRIDVACDDPPLGGQCGAPPAGPLAAHLGIEGAANEVIDLRGRPGAFLPGAKVMTLVHAAIAGATCIDHANVLRAGASEGVPGHRVLAPSTLGRTFLRSFTFGHVRRLGRLSEIALAGVGRGCRTG